MSNNLMSATLAGVALSCAFAASARAYSNGTHYVITEAITSACEVPHAKLVAWADAYVDLNSDTSPEIPYHFSARKLFHFRTTPTPPIYVIANGQSIDIHVDLVVRGSPESAAIVDQAINRGVSDQVLLGIGLHAYQDSWAHEGYEPVWGHLFMGFIPDDPGHDSGRTIEMAKATWEKIDLWSRAQLSQPCAKPWPEVWNTVEPLVHLSTTELKKRAGTYPNGVPWTAASETFKYWINQIRDPNFFK